MSVPPGWKRMDSILSVIAVGLTVGCAGFLVCSGGKGFWLSATIAIWISWTLAPPAWFLIEWSRFDRSKLTSSDEFARLKYSQELASKFWIAGVGLLSALLAYYKIRA